MIRRWLGPWLTGKDIVSGQDLQEALSGIKGNQFAKAALDLAWWDLYARSLDQPLWKLIGGVSPTVNVGADFGVMESLDSLLQEIGKARDAGFQRVKLKFRPGWDLDMVAAARRAFPTMTFHIDCNGAYRLGDTHIFQRLDQYELAMIEQPLSYDDLFDHAELQRGVRTPLCLDESITSSARARQAIALKACGWINIKPGRVGGLTHAIAIHDLCRDAGMPCWVGGMLESGVGQSFNLALATLSNIKYPCDLFPSSRFYQADLAETEVVLSGPGQITAGERVGIGCGPDTARLRRATIQQAVVR